MARVPAGAAGVMPFLLLFAGEFMLFLLAIWWFRRLSLSVRMRSAFLLGFAVLFRLALLFSPPILDNDVYRYRWDGKVLASGINPYRYSPDARELAHLRDDLDDNIGYPYIPTIYPPLSQVAFYLGYRLTPGGVLGQKVVVVAFDLLTLMILILLLRELSYPLPSAAFYAWHPLILKEFANSGHQDALGIFFLLLFAYVWVRRKPLSCALALAASGLFKLFPLLFFAFTKDRLRARHYLAAIGLITVAYLPFSAVGPGAFEGLGAYIRHWEFNSGLFALLRCGLEFVTDSSFEGAQAIATLGLLSILIALTRRSQSQETGRGDDLLTNMTLLLGAMLLLAPTVDPWYVCWLVPFLCFKPFPAGVLFTATVVLSYVYHLDDQQHWWVQTVEYAGVYLLLARQLAARRHSGREGQYPSRRPA